MNQLGIYEQLITQLVEHNLDRTTFFVGERKLESAEAAVWLSRFLTRLIELAINSVPESGEQLQNQIELANKFIYWLKDHIHSEQLISENLISAQGKILTALYSLENPLSADLQKYTDSIFPLTGLTQSELFCGSNAELSLETEIKREINSADQIYWLVSFIKWAGIRIFKNELKEFTRNSGKQLRVITTSYMGATDAKAVEFLASLPNTEVKLSYNTHRERLHAKAYLFARNTGFHTGYIGSSNLSHSALTSGLEWNLKITSQEIPHIIKKSLNMFEAYWQSSDFEQFDGKADSKERLARALADAGRKHSSPQTYYFDVKPFPHQREILDLLENERTTHGRYKNLVVAATGTGKTIISAFDFDRFRKVNPHARFLFVAHRREILEQARDAYRGVLRDGEFGELWVGNDKPTRFAHLFASIQSINNQIDILPLSENYFDFLVIDEVHHVPANSYRALLQKFHPKILLGLTATPERHDGGNVLADFCGVIAAEIRLPEAINRRHLCPFQYFVIEDGTDLRRISWRQGRYDVAELTNLYSHNDQRISRIIRSLEEIITDISNVKALAFCVSKEHALYMTEKFLLHKIPCDYLTSDNSSERALKRQLLVSGEIKFLFVVDIFNEGVDIPEVDTLLFLRPTESLTIFLQQLGRGLRLSDSKECCTVLDFVGNSRPDYDFAQKFRALVGKNSQSIAAQIAQGFPHLPLGCRIELEEKAQEIVLRNIRDAIFTPTRLLGLISNFKHQSNLPLSLTNFLQIYPNCALEDIYRIKTPASRGWTMLVNEATANSVSEPEKLTLFSAYYRAINTQFLGCSSVSYLRFLWTLCENDFRFDDTDPMSLRYATMCHYNFWDKPGPALDFHSLAASLQALKHAKLQLELSEVLNLLIERSHANEQKLHLGDLNTIKLHARFTREQILAGFGATTFESRSSSREGVLFLKEQNTELLFVTLDKSEKRFTPTTMYHDYAISDTEFQWQSQNTARPDSGRGLSYVNQQQLGTQILLFVREKTEDENGRTIGFVNFGRVHYITHQGSNPMTIRWKLESPMPAMMWHEAAKLAVG